MGKLEISIGRITVVGDLKKDQSENLNRELKFNSYVQLYKTGEEVFKADIPNICHAEYVFLKGKSLDRKNMHVEFNPNNLSYGTIEKYQMNISVIKDVPNQVNLGPFF
ncbi:hypothetical protein [Desemzia incerta]|uniref:hypothetical protein n=1 Tax=Desemzia incerta TaxID=82801 RepID=UPI00166066CD|nr:hypothetical protein [Desemzia incerta]